jgi:transcriptional regulator with XRE-family HTH domain
MSSGFADSKERVPPEVRRPRVGGEIRRWRNERGQTLAQVAASSGLNIGYLSQIENDKASPSLDALAAIGSALDVPIAWFLLDATPPPRIVRASERRTYGTPGGGAAFEVDGGVSRDVRIVEVSVPPGLRTGLHAHTGDEHHVVLTGRWRFAQGEHVAELGPGDYIVWDAAVPHDVENVGDEPGRMLLVYPRRGAAGGAASSSSAADSAAPQPAFRS